MLWVCCSSGASQTQCSKRWFGVVCSCLRVLGEQQILHCSLEWFLGCSGRGLAGLQQTLCQEVQERVSPRAHHWALPSPVSILQAAAAVLQGSGEAYRQPRSTPCCPIPFFGVFFLPKHWFRSSPNKHTCPIGRARLKPMDWVSVSTSSKLDMGKKEHYKNVCDAFGFVTGFSGEGEGGRRFPNPQIAEFSLTPGWSSGTLSPLLMRCCSWALSHFQELVLLDDGHTVSRGIAHPELRVYRQKPGGKTAFCGFFHGVTALPKSPPDLCKGCSSQVTSDSKFFWMEISLRSVPWGVTFLFSLHRQIFFSYNKVVKVF